MPLAQLQWLVIGILREHRFKQGCLRLNVQVGNLANARYPGRGEVIALVTMSESERFKGGVEHLL